MLRICLKILWQAALHTEYIEEALAREIGPGTSCKLAERPVGTGNAAFPVHYDGGILQVMLNPEKIPFKFFHHGSGLLKKRFQAVGAPANHGP